MKNLIIVIATLLALGSMAVPMLEDWDLGSIDTMGSDQIERIQE
jgi:hypothetical protein